MVFVNNKEEWKRNDKTDYISGDSLSRHSKWLFCDRMPVILNPDEIEYNDILFLNLTYFNEFMSIIERNKPGNKFILISFNSDIAFTEYYYNLLEEYVTKVYAVNNVIYTRENVYTLPIGFRVQPVNTINILKEIKTENIKKTILVYMNFNLGTNESEREICYNKLINKKWITSLKNRKMEDFYDDILKSKYAICPEGTGIDTHRLFEALYLNCIPIVKRSLLDPFYKRMPILIIEDWNDLTNEYLINEYERLYNNLINWKIDNKKWYTATYWLKGIKDY